jgi:hypothetical protein
MTASQPQLSFAFDDIIAEGQGSVSSGRVSARLGMARRLQGADGPREADLFERRADAPDKVDPRVVRAVEAIWARYSSAR